MLDGIVWDARYIVSQVFVLLAIACLAISYLTKNKKLILILSIANATLYAIQYYLLGSYMGILVDAVAIIRGIWYYIDDKNGKRHSLASLIIISLMFIGCAILTYKSPFDLFAVAASILYTVSIWVKGIKFYRWSAPFQSVMWVVFNLSCKSMMSVLFELPMFVIEIIGIRKISLKPKKE